MEFVSIKVLKYDLYSTSEIYWQIRVGELVMGNTTFMSANRKPVDKLLALVVVLAVGFWSGSVLAQGIEEIVVTAQKREQSVQDVGISITAFSADDLRRYGLNDPIEVGNLVSNTEIMFGFSQPFFAIRGVGVNEFAGNIDQPVAAHVDEIYLSKAAQLQMGMFDMERVEVLKGPQGTLFGRNTTGGSVNFYTRKPTRDFEAGYTLGVGRFEEINGEGFVSGGISENVSGRLSAYYRRSLSGPTKNDPQGFPSAFPNRFAAGSTIGKLNEFGIRAQLLWQPNSKLDVLGQIWGGEYNSEVPAYGVRGTITPQSLAASSTAAVAAGLPPNALFASMFQLCPQYMDGTLSSADTNCVNFAGFAEGDNDPFSAQSNNANVNANDSLNGSLRIDYDLEWASLTSITALMRYVRDFHEDSFASPVNYGEVDWYNGIDEFTQEIRLASNDSDGLNWLVGLFYMSDEVEVVNTFDSSDFPLVFSDPVNLIVLNGPGFLSTEYRQKTDAYAAFVNTEYQFNERLSLVVGGRYSYEEKALTNSQTLLAPIPGIPTEGPEDRIRANGFPLVPGFDDRRSDNDFSYKVGLNYFPGDNALLFANISTGFRSGGFNGGLVTPGTAASFEPETVTAFELGAKTEWFENTVRVNASFFFYDYKNAQENVDAPGGVNPIPIPANADSREHVGFELDAWWVPNDAWTIQGAVGYLDAEYTGDFFVNGVNLRGNTPVNSPKWNLNGMARYSFSVSGDLVGAIQADFNWRDDKFLEVTNVAFAQQDAYALFNGRFSIGPPDGKWEAALWGKNLGDEEYLTYMNDLSFFGVVLDVYGYPRTFGAEYSYRF